MVTIIRSDLEFILDQILIGEANAWTSVDLGTGLGTGGTPLTSLVADPILMEGIRTVDGSFNNLTPGGSYWGAADQPFARLTDASYRTVEGSFDLNGPADGGVIDGNYGRAGSVYDPTIRMISNLISDQSTSNPAAVEAAGEGAAVSPTGDLDIPNVAPDLGLSAPFNSWMTLFGQFFDHGLDLVNKGGNGIVFMPLSPDDPLYVPGGQTNFMVLTRATADAGQDGILGTADDTTTNQTTPYVDQNQTYTSHASHQALLREYVRNEATGQTVSTGHLLDGAEGGLATWADIKAQAQDLLGINLTDDFVTNLPLLATDQYGRLLLGSNGYAQIVVQTAPGTYALLEGDPAANGGNGVTIPANVVLTGHAALDDIAHSAGPRNSQGGMLAADADNVAGVDDGNAATYDDELLGVHFATGDGRGNENIGLTAVHTVFHAEHNRMVEQMKEVILGTGDAAFIAQWQTAPGEWNGERLFQAARFSTEMQYQHLVFEEFARKIQPQVDVFLAYDTTINPAIFAEFAHTVYRFGHSMLRDTIDRFDPNFNVIGSDASTAANPEQIGLIEAFLNPLEFNGLDDDDPTNDLTAAEATAAVVRGMTRQVGAHIDEFVTSAVRDNLLGLPLDLAALNLARGRDTGIPSLNDARREFFAGTQDALLRPYESWVDFAGHLKNEGSIINFIAAYGTHDSITSATTAAAKRAAAVKLVMGDATLTGDELANFEADRADFLNGQGAYTDKLGGLDLVDFWIGGLAEETMPFGGMLGSTFNFIFETQMENLQSGDRFYYLGRLAGTNFLNELENNSFASLIMRNTDVRHLPADVFSTPGFILEVNQDNQFNEGLGDNPNFAGLGDADPATNVIRNNPATVGPDTNYLRYTGDQHVVLGGTDNADTLIASEGDDALYGDGGNDRIEGGFGNDNSMGGDGDDIITDAGGDDVIKGEGGHDAINGGNGINLIIGGDGSDFIVTGEDISEVFGGRGNDFIYGAPTNEVSQGNEGDDWIETGTADGATGDNFDAFGRDQVEGHDVFLGSGGADEFVGEGGDDIMVGSPGVNRNEGMSGFDWVTYKDNVAVYADLLLPAFDETPLPPGANTALDRYAEVEGLSGSAGADQLFGDEEDATTIPVAGQRGSTLTAAGIARIDGLSPLLAGVLNGTGGFDAGNIILGGDGSDVITGRGGDDVIDGDRWLNVRIGVNAVVDGRDFSNITSMKQIESLLFDGTINGSQLSIVREILRANGAGDIDVAVYSGALDEYEITALGSGAYRIAHTGGTQADGVDTVRNIERLHFLNNNETNDPTIPVTVVALNANTAAEGVVAISNQSPTDGSQLTALTGALTDPDGGVNQASFTYVWQATTDAGATWTTVGTGATFVPGQSLVGARLRVTVNFLDGQGNQESSTSLLSDVVGDLWTGSNSTDPLLADNFIGSAGADNATARAGNDVLNGNGGNDILRGDGGNDSAYGGGGNDSLLGGTGADLLNGGGGIDYMEGGAAGDIYIVDHVADVVNETSTGIDTVRTTLNSYQLQASVENLQFIGTGNFTGLGNSLVNAITGGAGADTLDGGAGVDRLVGLGGNDIFLVDTSTENVVEAVGGGIDTIRLSAASYTNRANIENVVYVGAGNVTIQGNGGAETFQGGAGADTLNGLGGADRLTGGEGNDTMNGGTGLDTFVFLANFGNDRISGFDADALDGQDRLNVAGLGITAGNFDAGVSITSANGGLDTLVTIGANSITLAGVVAGAITQDDFILA